MNNKSKLFVASLTAASMVIGCCAFAACDSTPEEEVPVTYSITFDANGGLYGTGETTVLKTDENGRIATKPNDPVRDDYDFVKYTTNKNGSGTEVTFGATGYVFKADVTVYAQWVESEPNPGPGPEPGEEVTVTLDAGEDGTLADSDKSLTTVGGKLEELPVPEVAEAKAELGWVFDKWVTVGEDDEETAVTEETGFTGDCTIYARYRLTEGLYTLDDKLLAPLEYIAPADSAENQYGSTSVTLAPGTVFVLKLEGKTLTHEAKVLELWTTNACHGVNFNQSKGTFTVKNRGGERPFSIYAGYYTDGTPCWSISMTDGLKDELVLNGSYLVGLGWEDGSWSLSADNYIDPENGLIVTFDSTTAENSGTAFKITSCNNVTTGGMAWDHNTASHYSWAEGSSTTGLKFSTISGSGNAQVLEAGTYKITVTGTGSAARFEFTKIEEEPDGGDTGDLEGGFGF